MTAYSSQSLASSLAKSGDSASQFAAGILFEFGWGVQRDEQRATHLYEAASVTVAAARYRLALRASDMEVGLRHLRAAADAGFAPAMFDLWGLEGEKDSKLLERAAELNYPPALAELGQLYLEGTVVPGDQRRGEGLLRRAFELGEVEAGADLATTALQSGQPEEFAAALDLLRKSAELGSARAHSILSSLYSRGEYGLPKDRGLATFHSDQAASLSGDQETAY